MKDDNMGKEPSDACIDMHRGLDPKNSDLIMVFDRLGYTYNFVKYESKRDANGVNEVSFTATREKKPNLAPYWVMVSIGVAAIIAFAVMVCIPKSSLLSVTEESKIRVENHYESK